MASSSDLQPSPPSVGLRWLRALRVLAAACTIPLWGTLFMASLTEHRKFSQIAWSSFLLIAVPGSLPFFHILFRLRNREDLRKSGIALAVWIGLGWGAVGLVLSVLWIRVGDVSEIILFALGAMLLLALGAIAVKTYYTMEPEEDDRKILGRAFGPFAFYSALLFVSAVGLS